ncbi:MAG: competence/damage-inducible protein A [Oscillospiraceae bacterium]|nr:competence/damage-inducible protein A [Oscillospiraceae bacterium]
MAYCAEIIGVGTELLLGNTVNTDARDVSEGLSALGINVYYHTVVGDNPDRLRQAVEIARGRADILITTGGLGPTFDDLTKETLAQCFGKELIYHEEIGTEIRAYFEKRLPGQKMPENNLRQAYLPEGCTVFQNDWGTAPGCAFFAEDKHVLMLPGPPRECREMFNHCAVPYLKGLSDAEILSHNIHIFGMGESAVEDKLRGLMEGLTNPTLAPYAKTGEVMLRLTAKAESGEAAEAQMAPVLDQVRAVLGDVIYGVDTDSLEATVLGLLLDAGKTIAVAESCTGGLLTKRLTDIPGASGAFLGGVIAYANQVKTDLLGVDEALIEQLGAVSDPVARSMAQGVRIRLGTDFGIGITGVAGPGGGTEEKPVGTVYVAMATADQTYVRSLRLGNDRSRIRVMAAHHALDMVRRYLTGLPVEGSGQMR